MNQKYLIPIFIIAVLAIIFIKPPGELFAVARETTPAENGTFEWNDISWGYSSSPYGLGLSEIWGGNIAVYPNGSSYVLHEYLKERVNNILLYDNSLKVSTSKTENYEVDTASIVVSSTNLNLSNFKKLRINGDIGVSFSSDSGGDKATAKLTLEGDSHSISLVNLACGPKPCNKKLYDIIIFEAEGNLFVKDAAATFVERINLIDDSYELKLETNVYNYDGGGTASIEISGIFIDTDGDGIWDRNDNCPNVAGLENGCPSEPEYVCFDGSIVMDPDNCPVQEIEVEIICWDGSRVNNANDCPPTEGNVIREYVCSDGTIVDNIADCPIEEPVEEPGEENGMPLLIGDNLLIILVLLIAFIIVTMIVDLKGGK